METINFKINDRIMKEKSIDRIIDYLNEETYSIDKDLADDNYFKFFECLYDLFKNKGIEKLYFSIVSQYISKCLVEINQVTVNELVENLDLIMRYNVILPDFCKLKKDEISSIKELYKPQKQKFLLAN